MNYVNQRTASSYNMKEFDKIIKADTQNAHEIRKIMQCGNIYDL